MRNLKSKIKRVSGTDRIISDELRLRNDHIRLGSVKGTQRQEKCF